MIRITSHSIIIIIVSSLLIILSLPGTIGAQATTARLSGMVWDPSDNPTPGVIITAVEENTGWQSEAVSDENGRYEFLALRPGFYTLFTKARGFQQMTRRNIYLSVNGSITESFTLDIATADETVDIEASVPTENSDIYGNLSSRDLETLPSFSRNPLDLVVNLPGIQTSGGSEEISTANGARVGMNNINMDGLVVSDPVNPQLGKSMIAINPDSIETIHLITSGAKAEFGGTAGAQLGIVSRFGGRTWHGNVYNYFANKSLNANEFINKSEGNERPNFRRNMFGGTVSGPLMNSRTLIFGNYEGRRMGSNIQRNRLVLMDDFDDDEGEDVNDEAKAGVFRWRTPGLVEIQSFDIVANDPKGLGMDPHVADIIAMLPSPNNFRIGDRLNTAGYSFDNPTLNNSDQATVRIDHTLKPNHRLYLRLNWGRIDATDTWNNADATFLGYPEGTIRGRTWALAAGSHYIINPRMVNELRIGYVRPKTEFRRPARSSDPMLLANSWTNPLNPDFQKAYISPFFEISDSLSHSFNKHTFKYGASFRRTQQKSVDYAGVSPNISFGTSNGNNVPEDIGPWGNTVISDEDRQTFENLYNDILGRVESMQQTYYYDSTSTQSAGTGRERSFSTNDISAFIQDDWRIRPNLTLNLGLRYDYFGVPSEQNGLQRLLIPSSDISTTANISDFTFASGEALRNRNISNFAPRIGFAWDISKYGTAVLRGSYGTYYDRPIGAITNYIDANTYGFSQIGATYPNAGGQDVRLSENFPYPTEPPAPDLTLPVTRSTSIAIFNPNLRTARIDRFNLTIERRMGRHMVLEASYIRARGRNLYQNLNANQTKVQGDFLQAFQEIQAYREMGTPVPDTNTLVQIFGSPIAVLDALGGYSFDTGQAGLAANTLDKGYYDLYEDANVSDFYIRNYPQFDQLIVGTDIGQSWYDALQGGLRINSGPLRLRAHYTWGKSLDTLSTDGGEFTSPSDSFVPITNKAPSDFDRSHIFNLSTNFNVPFGRDRRWGSEANKVFDSIIGGWEFGVLGIWQSGQRFSVTSGRETLYGDVTSLANYSGKRDIGQLHYVPFGVYWFDPTEMELFTYPEEGETGTSGRNSFKGPKYFNIDLTLFKHFRIGEDNRIEVRAEFYNLFNRPHFGIPNTDISNRENSTSGFGRITSTVGNPRLVQFALRYEF